MYVCTTVILLDSLSLSEEAKRQYNNCDNLTCSLRLYLIQTDYVHSIFCESMKYR